MLPDGIRQLPQGPLVEVTAGLAGVGDNVLNGDLVDTVGLVEGLLLLHSHFPFSTVFSILRLVHRKWNQILSLGKIKDRTVVTARAAFLSALFLNHLLHFRVNTVGQGLRLPENLFAFPPEALRLFPVLQAANIDKHIQPRALYRRQQVQGSHA